MTTLRASRIKAVAAFVLTAGIQPLPIFIRFRRIGMIRMSVGVGCLKIYHSWLGVSDQRLMPRNGWSNTDVLFASHFISPTVPCRVPVNKWLVFVNNFLDRRLGSSCLAVLNSKASCLLRSKTAHILANAATRYSRSRASRPLRLSASHTSYSPFALSISCFTVSRSSAGSSASA